MNGFKKSVMEQNFVVRIVRIKGQLESGLYTAEDVLDATEVAVLVSGKMRLMVSPPLQAGDECVVQCSPHETSRGRIINKTSLKSDQPLFRSYLGARKRYESLLGPYTDDYSLIQRTI